MMTVNRTKTLGGVLLLMTLASGCVERAPEEVPGPVTDDVYVDVMTQLLLVDVNPPKGASAEERETREDSVRAKILADHGVTSGDVLRYADALGSEAGRMESLWQRITQQFDSTRIANLEQETEALSEPEGKLGEDATVAQQEPTDADSEPVIAGAVADEQGAHAVTDSGAATPRIRRPAKRMSPGRRIVADSTGQRR